MSRELDRVREAMLRLIARRVRVPAVVGLERSLRLAPGDDELRETLDATLAAAVERLIADGDVFFRELRRFGWRLVLKRLLAPLGGVHAWRYLVKPVLRAAGAIAAPPVPDRADVLAPPDAHLHLLPSAGHLLCHLRHHDPTELAVPPWYRDTGVPTDAPVISIVTPSFNQAGFLGRTIASVCEQAYPRLEYVLQDGGSSDGSLAVIGRYAGRLSDWESGPDGGQAAAVNRGHARTRGTIMAWLNSDDLLLPGALAAVARFFTRHPEVDVVYGHRVIIDEDDREVGRWILPAHDPEVLRWADFVPQETLFWRRRIWDRVGGLDETFRFAMDWDLLLRFQEAGARIVRLPRFLGAFRLHGRSKTVSAMATLGDGEMGVLRRRVAGAFPTSVRVWHRTCAYIHRASLFHHYWTQVRDLF